ncbi:MULTISPECIES: hypothetical protein [Cyanophyceae]|nr:hypothetical protein [Trichocoleus sp. FACHB-69]
MGKRTTEAQRSAIALRHEMGKGKRDRVIFKMADFDNLRRCNDI